MTISLTASGWCGRLKYSFAELQFNDALKKLPVLNEILYIGVSKISYDENFEVSKVQPPHFSSFRKARPYHPASSYYFRSDRWTTVSDKKKTPTSGVLNAAWLDAIREFQISLYNDFGISKLDADQIAE